MSSPPDEFPIPKDIAVELLMALVPVPLAPATQAAILERVAKRIRVGDAHDPAIVTTVRAEEGTWSEFLPGVAMKILFNDGCSITWLARMDSGSRIPAHDHAGDEEFLVLKGSVLVGDLHMGAGDYQHLRAGGRHADCFSEEGCVVLLRSPSSLCAFDAVAGRESARAM